MRRSIVSRVLGVAVALVALGLAACGQKQGPAPAPSTPVVAPSAPTLADLRGATVSGVFDHAVTLTNGKYDGPPAEPGAASHPTAMLWEPAVVFGDMDGSAGNEAVAMLSSNSGGSGEFVYIAVFGVRDGKLANLGTAEVGDRVKLQSLWLQSGQAIMDVVEAGPKDPACCPTQLARKTYAFEGGALKQTKSEVLGTLTMGTLAANEWQLVSIDGQPLPAGVKPPVIHFERESVRGFAGCNRFTAPIKETAPGEIDIGPVAATKMACPPAEMELEQRFLAALDKVGRYTFLAGQLALSWTDKDGSGTLLFSK
jgi:heat shock protein HslJ/predicted small lipoprotein YifL